MKKLLFATVISILFSVTGMAQNSTLTNEYTKYTESGKYSIFKASLETFYIRINPSGESLNISTNTNLREWLRINISNTTFNNINDAYSSYDDLLKKSEEVMSDNRAFFTLIADNPEGLTTLITNSNPINTTNTTNDSPCVFECINVATDCGKAADNVLAADLGLSAAAFWGGNPALAAALYYNGYIKHNNAQHVCAESFKTCVKNCDN